MNLRFAALVSATLAVFTTAAQPALAGKQARPDLVIAEGALTGRDYAIPGEENVLRLTDETANMGYRAAGKSTTGVSFSAPKSSGENAKPQGFTRPVRKIKGFVGDSSLKTTRSPVLRFPGIPLGAYDVTICADVRDQVKERNERNNCLTGRDSHLFVTKRTWSGTLAGSAPARSGSLRDDWSSTDGTLELSGYRGDGEFSYNFGGTVTWATSGTDAADCTWSGSGSETFSARSDEHGDLFLDLDPDGYQATLSGFEIEYPTSGQCPTGPRTSTGPDNTTFLDTGAGGGGPQPFPFGSEAIAGTSGGAAGSWAWDFR